MDLCSSNICPLSLISPMAHWLDFGLALQKWSRLNSCMADIGGKSTAVAVEMLNAWQRAKSVISQNKARNMHVVHEWLQLPTEKRKNDHWILVALTDTQCCCICIWNDKMLLSCPCCWNRISSYLVLNCFCRLHRQKTQHYAIHSKVTFINYTDKRKQDLPCLLSTKAQFGT